MAQSLDLLILRLVALMPAGDVDASICEDSSMDVASEADSGSTTEIASETQDKYFATATIDWVVG